jgi:hypothetical protein
MRQSTNRRVAACTALGLSVGATALAVIVATGASADPARDATLRAASSPAPKRAAPPPRVRIAWVGDTMFGHGSAVPPDGGDGLFAQARDQLRAADLTFGNLEGVLATGGVSKCGLLPSEHCYAFRAAPAHAGALRRAGFDLVNVANNHAWDYGATGQAETIAALEAARVGVAGLPGAIAVRTRNGIRVAFVGFAPYPWAAPLLDIPAAQALVRTAAARADVVVAAMHAGAEGAAQTTTPLGRETAFGEDRGETRAFAHAVIDAGADLVVGSGPHVVRGLERYRSRLVAYSLGNFAGWHNFGTGGVLSLSGVLDVTLDRSGRPVRGSLASMTIAPPGVPVADPAGATGRLVDELSVRDFGAAAVRVGAEGRLGFSR